MAGKPHFKRTVPPAPHTILCHGLRREVSTRDGIRHHRDGHRDGHRTVQISSVRTPISARRNVTTQGCVTNATPSMTIVSHKTLAFFRVRTRAPRCITIGGNPILLRASGRVSESPHSRMFSAALRSLSTNLPVVWMVESHHSKPRIVVLVLLLSTLFMIV